MLDGIRLQRRRAAPVWLEALAFAGGLALAAAVVVVVLLSAGAQADMMFEDLIVQVFIAPAGLLQTITIAIPLVLAGLASSIAMRVKFWNIGIEGQLWLGAIGATSIAIADIGPEKLRLPLMLATSALFGAAWIALPLFLKLRFAASEIVLSLLLSSIAYLLLQHLLFGAWRDPANSFPVSPQFGESERLGLLWGGSLHAGLWIALGCVLLAYVLFEKSRLGFYARATAGNPLAAAATGLPVAATLVAATLLSGAAAGLAGGVIVTGTEYRLTQFIGLNMTFSGIVVAFLARLKPLAILVSALAVAGVYSAGTTLKVFYGLSDAIVLLIQGIVLMCLLSGQFFSTYRITRTKAARS